MATASSAAATGGLHEVIGSPQPAGVQQVNPITMPHQNTQLLAALLFMLTSFAAATRPSCADSTANASKPNIVLIMADDMGFECVAANGGTSYQTPNLDRLAASGVRFEHCYSQPICTPSRVQIMTGLYNSRNYVRFGLLPPGAFTFGNLLQDAGYTTCVVGKWQLKGGFDGPKRFGFDEYCLWQLTRRPNRYPNPGLEINGKQKDYKNGEYGPDLVSDYACQFIDRSAAQSKPFFLYYPMILPHWPFEPTPDSLEWDPTARRDDVVEKGSRMKQTQFFDDMVHYVDKLVGKLVNRLEQRGLRNRTLILFTGDNGTFRNVVSKFRGRRWRGGKGRMTDSGTRVPLLVSWPGKIPVGRVVDDLVDFSDMLPTIANAAGVTLPDSKSFDGRSFLPQTRGEPGRPRESIYCWYFRNGTFARGGKKHSAGESARNHRYKLYGTGAFFDVVNDFEEQQPLAIPNLTAPQRQIHQQLQKTLNTYSRQDFGS